MNVPLIAANVKMNELPDGWDASDSPYRPKENVDVVLFPTFPDIDRAVAAKLTVGAQCGSLNGRSPRTGDVSIAMLARRGCRAVLCGHSERRANHHETNEEVARMAAAVLDAGMIPIVCVGETADQREMGETEEIVAEQISVLPKDARIVIAYEPCWAIGTGSSAKPDDVQRVHAFIRASLPDTSMRILYGGSVDGKNAEGLLSLPDVDGALVGTSSLKPSEFRAIVDVAARVFAAKK